MANAEEIRLKWVMH